MKELTNLQFLFLSLYAVAMNLLDIVTTNIGLSLGGTEMNPLMFGNIMLIVKLLVISIYIIFLNHIYVNTHDKVYKIGCISCVSIIAVFFSIVVTNNLLVILTLVKL